MSGNLPPGTSPADIDSHYGPSVADHEHEWMPVEGLSPVLEDMAAIFHEQCCWAEVVDSYTDHRRDETYYETGAECEAERHYRFELAYVIDESGTRVQPRTNPHHHRQRAGSWVCGGPCVSGARREGAWSGLRSGRVPAGR